MDDQAFKDMIDDAMLIPAKERVEQLTGVALNKKENSRRGTIWKGPCPVCGGTDRFALNENTNRMFCRKGCIGTDDHWASGIELMRVLRPSISFKDAVEDWTGAIVNRDTLQAMHDQRVAAAEAAAEQKEAKRQKMRERIAKHNLWQSLHADMTPEQRTLWLARGIPPDFQDRWTLGYTLDLYHQVYNVPLEVIEDEPSHREALVIPYLNGDGYAQFRYRVPNGKGTYHNLSLFDAVPFITQPDRPFDHVLIMEGAIKAMNGYLWGCGEKYQVIGAPSMSNLECVIPLLQKSKKAVIWLDPDTWIQPNPAQTHWAPVALRLAASLRKANKDLDIRIVKVAFKSDDAQLDGLDDTQFMNIVEAARPYERWPKLK